MIFLSVGSEFYVMLFSFTVCEENHLGYVLLCTWLSILPIVIFQLAISKRTYIFYLPIPFLLIECMYLLHWEHTTLTTTTLHYTTLLHHTTLHTTLHYTIQHSTHGTSILRKVPGYARVSAVRMSYLPNKEYP